MPTRLLLIRHAHVDTGDPARLCGTFDLPLSRTGREQVRAFCAALPPEAPRALYSSSLARAVETANAVGDAWGLVPHLDDGLREIHCGTLEGVVIQEIQRERGDLWGRNLAQDDDDFTWPGGESYAGFRRRIVASLARIADRHRNDSVAIVTHSGVVAQVMGIIKGRPAAVWEHDRPEPLSITEVAWGNGGPMRIVGFNERTTCEGSPLRLE